MPNKFHVPLAIQALEAGKHVILEKPFAMNAGEAEAAINVAKKSGLVLNLGMNQRFTSDSQKIKQLVEDGVLGEIYHAKAIWPSPHRHPEIGHLVRQQGNRRRWIALRYRRAHARSLFVDDQ